MTHIVILRGNSGSGKTTLAKELRKQFPGNTMIISQDVVRRDILGVRDQVDNPSIHLMYEMVQFGINHYDLIVVEGILSAHKYKAMLQDIAELGYPTEFYYYQLSFDDTLERHLTKETDEFGIVELKKWWVENDVLNVDNEYLISKETTLEAMVSLILERL